MKHVSCLSIREEVGVRSQEDYFTLNRSVGMLAKCLNYFFEPTDNEAACAEGIESVGIFLYPSLVKDLFELDVSHSDHRVGYNLKQVQIDRLLENYIESISILLDNPELVDDNMVKTKLKEFVLLISKSENAPSQLDFLAALFKPNEVAFKTTIQNNLYANLSLEELAALCHLSTSSFKRKFNDVFGVSPKKYISQKKVEKLRLYSRQMMQGYRRLPMMWVSIRWLLLVEISQLCMENPHPNIA